MNAETIGKELLQPTKDKCYESMKKRIQKYRNRNAPAGDIEPVENKMNERFIELLRECKPVLDLEISPMCDYAQRNRHVARFVGGLLVPDKCARLIADKESIRRIEAVCLPTMDGIWHPVFSGRFTYTLPDPDNLVKSKPVCRLRTPVLVDTLSWCASHSSRPGYLSLHGRKR